MKAKKWAVFAFAVIFLLAGCHQKEKAVSAPEPEISQSSDVEKEPDPNWPVEIRDVVLKEKPETVISLSPALTEMVYELGGSLSGVSNYCDFPEEVSSLERYGDSSMPDLEALQKNPPDLLLSSTPLSKTDQERLESLDVAVAVFPRAEDFDGIEKTYIDLGILLEGAEAGKENGETVFAALRERYQALCDKADGHGMFGIWLRDVPLMMATGDTFEGKLMEEALGIKNDAVEFEHWQYPPEKAVDLYPDVIFYDQSIDKDYFAGTQVYNTTDAYKQGRMYPFDALPFERQSGRMITELEHMAQAFAEGNPQGDGQEG